MSELDEDHILCVEEAQDLRREVDSLQARLKEAEELLRRYRKKGKGQTHGCMRLFPECDVCRETKAFLRGAK